jgi:2-pyrone-4,6-dicarboxylate lactonase
MKDEPLPTYHAQPSKPKLVLPPGAWDAHSHVFGPKAIYPVDPSWPVRADAPREMLFALHTMLGIERCVIVHSALHGLDNRVVEDALAAKGGAYLGVALLAPDVASAELKRLDRIGFRGVRYNFMRHLKKEATLDEVLALAPRLADVGWHLQIHVESEMIEEVGPRLAAMPVPIVVDHMGRIDAGAGIDQAPFSALMRMMESRNVWCKVSGYDRITRTGPPYADAALFAAKLVSEFPERVLWGLDWPHPNHQGPVPDDGELVDLIGKIAPTKELLAGLMVENPRRLYAERAIV